MRLEKSENIFYYLHFDILHFNIIAVESNTFLPTFYQFSDSDLVKLLRLRTKPGWNSALQFGIRGETYPFEIFLKVPEQIKITCPGPGYTEDIGRLENEAKKWKLWCSTRVWLYIVMLKEVALIFRLYVVFVVSASAKSKCKIPNWQWTL